MRLRSIYLVFLIAVFAGISCSRDPDNYAPEIEDILLQPGELLVPGLTVSVSALVSDFDGDELEFFWESEGGLIGDPHARETTWAIHSYAEPGSYESLSLTVSDGKESHRFTKSIQISEGYQLRGLVSFQSTRIPIAGARVEAGKLVVFTDSSGWYLFPSIRPGDYPVNISKEGFDIFDTVFHVKSPRSILNAELMGELFTATLSGKISTIDNLIFEGLRVFLLNPDGSETGINVLTGPDGSYELNGIPMGNRQLLVRSGDPGSHFLNDSLVVEVAFENGLFKQDIRIKVLREVFRDVDMSGQELWDFGGEVSNGFYHIEKGESLSLRDYVEMPPDAEKALVQLNSFVVGGCDMVGKVPSHRLWISNEDGEYIGGISWGGEGSNYPAILNWYPSESPTYLGVFGKTIKLNLEVHEENTCLPDPFWRIYEVALSYYY